MRRKNEGPCITFHLNAARPVSRQAKQKTRPGHQKSRRVPAYFSALISSPSTGSNFTPYQWSGSSRVFLMQARV